MKKKLFKLIRSISDFLLGIVTTIVLVVVVFNMPDTEWRTLSVEEGIFFLLLLFLINYLNETHKKRNDD